MKKTYYAHGMHCQSCQHMIGEKLLAHKKIKNIQWHGDQIEITMKQAVGLAALNDQLRDTQYALSTKRRISFKDIGIGIFVAITAYIVLRALSVDQYMNTDTISLGIALGMGFLASLSSCMAVTGGIVLSITSRLPTQAITRYIALFNISRIISYGLLGAALGYFGSIIQMSTTIHGIISISIVLFMLIIGLQMIGIIPPFFSLGLQSKYINTTIVNSDKGAIAIGSASFFFPCGFTQALQFYALSTGSIIQASSIMVVFSLGTLPSLIGIGYIHKLFSSQLRSRISGIAGSIIIIIGLSMIIPSLTLLGVSLPSSAPLEDIHSVPIIDGIQVIDMSINRLDYFPHQFIIKKDIPVRWNIDATRAVGCARVLQVPKLNIQTMLSGPTNIIEFTPDQLGDIPFHCSMAMTTPQAKFIVIE